MNPLNFLDRLFTLRTIERELSDFKIIHKELESKLGFGHRSSRQIWIAVTCRRFPSHAGRQVVALHKLTHRAER